MAKHKDDPERLRRHGVSERERQQIRVYCREHPGKPQRDAARFFTDQFRSPIRQSIVSDSLKPKYKYLDLLVLQRGQEGFERRRAPENPELEEALFEWQQRMQAADILVTGDLIRAMAIKLWNTMACYQGQQQPSFLSGWVDNFKKRNRISRRKLHGEAGSADTEGAEERMQELRVIVDAYPNQDVYNMDEAGLFYKATPDIGLATTGQSGTKKQKERITTVHCSNADGSHIVPLWIIGRAKNPRCFGTQRSNLRGLNFAWRFNKKAWMTALIFLDYIKWFDGLMGGRKVLLLIDSAPGHTGGMLTILERASLLNTRVEFLPKNVTSLYQPLDRV